MKRLVGGAVAMAAMAAVLTGPSLATAQAATRVGPQPNACTIGYEDGGARNVPTARKAGVVLREWIPVRNHEAVTLPNAYVTFLTTGDVQRRAPRPTVRWRVAGGQWKQARLTWASNSPIAQHESQWWSSNLEVGNIPVHGTRWVEVEVTFPRHSVKGAYYQLFLERSHSCSSAAVLTTYEAGVSYRPRRGREGQPV